MATAIDTATPSAKTGSMLRAFTLAFGQLGDPAILRVFAKSILITLGLFLAAGYAFVLATDHYVRSFDVGAEGGTLAGVVATLVAIAGAWILFRAVAVPVIGIFADAVVAAVEGKHYPGVASTARVPGFGLSLRLGLMSALRVIGVNLLMVPLYGMLLLTAIGPVIAFVAVNALLLGRDLGEMVAVRHLEGAAMRGWMRANRASNSLLGLVVTGLFVVPFVNLVAPILGAAMATHLFHRSMTTR